VLKQIGGDDLVRAIEAVGRGEALLDSAVTQRVFQEVRKAAREEEASAFADLTQQEMHVLQLVSEGRTNRQIAEMLYLGEGTVRNYVSSILSKLNVASKVPPPNRRTQYQGLPARFESRRRSGPAGEPR
jgi:DNA-binding NarL/FixJ family response regulator